MFEYSDLHILAVADWRAYIYPFDANKLTIVIPVRNNLIMKLCYQCLMIIMFINYRDACNYSTINKITIKRTVCSSQIQVYTNRYVIFSSCLFSSMTTYHSYQCFMYGSGIIHIDPPFRN